MHFYHNNSSVLLKRSHFSWLHIHNPKDFNELVFWLLKAVGFWFSVQNVTIGLTSSSERVDQKWVLITYQCMQCHAFVCCCCPIIYKVFWSTFGLELGSVWDFKSRFTVGGIILSPKTFKGALSLIILVEFSHVILGSSYADAWCSPPHLPFDNIFSLWKNCFQLYLCSMAHFFRAASILNCSIWWNMLQRTTNLFIWLWHRYITLNAVYIAMSINAECPAQSHVFLVFVFLLCYRQVNCDGSNPLFFSAQQS